MVQSFRQVWWVALVALMLVACEAKSQFDSKTWQSADLSPRHRVSMARDLVDTDQLRGFEKAKVIELLGEPTSTEKWKDADLVYVLGPESGLISIDYQWLLIGLDESGRVVSSRIVTD